MKKNVRTMIYLMILVVVAGGVYLWSQAGSGEDLLEGLDPASYDVEATCSGIENQNLVCNAGNDTYLCLDDVKVFLQTSDVIVNEKGDESTKVSYEISSLSDLKEMVQKKAVSIKIWLTTAGKVQTVMIVEQSFQNNNASLASLEGLEPSSYTSSNTILNVNKSGMRLAPINYDAGQKDKFAGFIKDYKFAKNVKFYSETVIITVDGDNKDINKNIQYSKTTYAQIRDNLQFNANAYVWFNKYGNISAVMTFTETRVRDMQE